MSSEPPFTRIAIVGLGLIGGSIAFAARKTWPSLHVVGIDRDGVLGEAVARRAIDSQATELKAVAGADLVILAAPVRQNLTLLRQVAGHLSPDAIVTDVGGTKRAIVEAASGLPPDVTFVGGHPLGGGARGGFEFATGSLFSRRPWIFTPPENPGTQVSRAVERLSAFVMGIGAQPATMTPERHDALMALISHLPQLAVTALMEVVGTAANGDIRFAGQGLVDTTRLASSPAAVWRDICATNADEIARALDLLIERLSDLRADLHRAEIIDSIFDQAAHWRSELMRGRE